MDNNTFALTLDSDAFEVLREDFNKILRQTIMTMEQQESETAEMTVKLKITLQKDTAPDYKETRYPAERDIIKPIFTHKVSSVLQMKFEESGLLAGAYELVWDEESGYYIRRLEDRQIPLLNDDNKYEQLSLMEDSYEYEDPHEEGENAE